ncbi:hypothetical protein FXO37_20772 [Capsicum annuum]|nr:hypothetical protein FXO37_20772 [Capsicum annuum]
MAILQLSCVNVVEDTTSDDVSSDNDFQDAPLAEKIKGKKKVDTASSQPHKKQKQLKSVPSSSNIPSNSSLRNTTSTPIFVSKALKRTLSPIAKYQTKKVVTQKTVPQRALPKQSSILEKIKSIVKPSAKPKPSNVPTDVPSNGKSDEEFILGSNVEAAADIPTVPQSSPQHINASCFSVSNKFDSSTVELQRDDNVEAVEDILVVSQPSSQHIGTDRSSNPKQGDTCSVELQQILEENPHQMHTSDDQVIEETESQYEIPDELLPSLKLVKRVQTFAEVIPSSLLNIEFYKKKIDIDWHCHPKYRNKDESDPFEVILLNNITQQKSGSMNCGIYVAAYEEFLTGGQDVPNQEFDIALLRTRYAALLWDYDRKKKKNGATSDHEAPAKIHRPFTDWDSSKDVTIL